LVNFITRPIFAGVVAISMVNAGLVGYLFLSIAQFPEIAPPQIVVTAAYVGAGGYMVYPSTVHPRHYFSCNGRLNKSIRSAVPDSRDKCHVQMDRIMQGIGNG
jgi:hypothetical protein